MMEQTMKVIVTGATGFTGSHTVPLLVENGIQVRCLVRKTSDLGVLSGMDVETVVGDLDDIESLMLGFKGVDALINIASLGFGHAPNIVDAANSTGVKRSVFLSTTAIFTTLETNSKAVRMAAEEMIVKNVPDYTILRPTMIYGGPGDRNICRLINYLNKFPLIPIFGNGNYLQQPVFVMDVARAIVDALISEKTVCGSYNIAGSEALTFNRMIQIVCEALGRKIYPIHLPTRPLVETTKLLEKFGCRFPLKAEQILRLNEHKQFDYTDAMRDFDYRPRSFAEGVELEISGMMK